MFVIIQIGQCGNQLGQQFFKNLKEAVTSNKDPTGALEDTKNRFFNETDSDDKQFARAVLVDTEPKVIAEASKSAKLSGFQYHKENVFVKKEGAANNWAMGYYVHGQNAHDEVLSIIQHEAERCDNLQGFLPFMSVGGGTGSGFGTSISELLKDEFPSVPVMNQMIWPFSKGEVTVQSYNSVFTLSHLQNTSDGFVLFENDELYRICTDRIGLKTVSLNDLNLVASQQLVSLLFPSNTSSGFTSFFGDILAHLVPHPQFKLVNLRSVPQEPISCHSYSTYTWKTLLRTLRRMLLFNSIVEEYVPFEEPTGKASRELPVSLSNLLLLRGVGAESVDPNFLHQPSLPYASWVPLDARLKAWTHPMPLFKQQRTATVANNGQILIPRINQAISKAWNMYTNKAYVHHYKSFGMEEEDFINCFTTMEQLVGSYNVLTSD